MTPTHPNGHSGDATVGAAGLDRPKPASPLPVAVAVPRVIDLPTDVIRTPPDNEIDMEVVEEIRCSMAEHGQFVEIIAYPDPALAAHYVCADGNHRLIAKRLLGQPIRARILDKAPDEAELITIRVTTATIGKTADRAALGADIFRWMELTGADQMTATAHFGYASPSAISKLLRPYKNGIPELLLALKERRIAPACAYLVAAQPPEVQRAILPQCLGRKREAVAKFVQAARGGKPRSTKVMKIVCGDVVATVKGEPVAALKAFIARVAEALKKLERDKLPPQFLVGLMQ